MPYWPGYDFPLSEHQLNVEVKSQLASKYVALSQRLDKHQWAYWPGWPGGHRFGTRKFHLQYIHFPVSRSLNHSKKTSKFALRLLLKYGRGGVLNII